MAYISVRRYEGMTDIEEVVRRTEAGFVPIVSSTPGFIAYHAIDSGGGVVATISIFETQAGAEESNRRAADWVKENLASFVSAPPQITAGETLVSHQA